MSLHTPLPTRGAVTFCRFPLIETPLAPGPVLRPALVLKLFRDPETDTQKVIVAYGTSRRNRSNAGLEIRISEPGDIAQAGLEKPTRFTLTRMRLLPLAPDFFRIHPQTGSPVFGYIPLKASRYMDGLCRALASQHDLLASILPDPRADREDIDTAGIDRYLRQKFTGSVTRLAGDTPAPKRKARFLGR